MTRTALTIALLALVAPAAFAAGAGYDTLTFTERASDGLAVQPPLDEFRAVSSARVIVPANWTRTRRSASRPRYLTSGNANCRFNVSYAVRSRIGEPGSADAFLDASIGGPANAHAYEEGRRNGHPFRVIKVSSSPDAQLRGMWVGILTRRKDVAPAGKVVWSVITVEARARPNDECHSGTVHNAAREIADGLSIATARLKFVKP